MSFTYYPANVNDALFDVGEAGNECYVCGRWVEYEKMWVGSLNGETHNVHTSEGDFPTCTSFRILVCKKCAKHRYQVEDAVNGVLK
jgi:hypothetical protein